MYECLSGIYCLQTPVCNIHVMLKVCVCVCVRVCACVCVYTHDCAYSFLPAVQGLQTLCEQRLHEHSCLHGDQRTAILQ